MTQPIDTLIERIRQRVADPLRAVDSATWVVPMPTIRRPASPTEVDAAEEALGFPIPPLLRRLYVEVGNGGFGPSYGLEGVPRIPQIPGAPDVVALYEMYSSPPPPGSSELWHWPLGLVPLISGGCLFMECVDFLQPPHAVFLFDGGDFDWERPVIESMRSVAPSLARRLEIWLDQP